MPGLLEKILEYAEFVDDRVFEEIDDREAGAVDAQVVGFIDGDELFDPAVEEGSVAGADRMAPGEFLEGARMDDRCRDLPVFVHAARAVGVEFAEPAFQRVFVQEDVEAAEGKKRVVSSGEQDQVDEAFVEVVDMAVRGVLEVCAHDLDQDGVRRLGDMLECLSGPGVVQARHVGRIYDDAVADGR